MKLAKTLTIGPCSRDVPYFGQNAPFYEEKVHLCSRVPVFPRFFIFSGGMELIMNLAKNTLIGLCSRVVPYFGQNAPFYEENGHLCSRVPVFPRFFIFWEMELIMNQWGRVLCSLKSPPFCPKRSLRARPSINSVQWLPCSRNVPVVFPWCSLVWVKCFVLRRK